MIANAKREGSYIAVVLCDECGREIDDAFTANALASSAPAGKSAEVLHVHKGAWESIASARLGGEHGSEELSVHLIEVLRNATKRSDPKLLAELIQQDDQRN